MTDPAQATSTSVNSTVTRATQPSSPRLIANMRTAFAKTGQAAPTDFVSQPVASNQSIPTASTSIPVSQSQAEPTSTAESLAVLETLLTEVEQNRAKAQTAVVDTAQPSETGTTTVPTPQAAEQLAEQLAVTSATPGVVAQALPSAVVQASAQDQLQYQPPTGTSFKESVSSSSIEAASAELPSGVQAVEHEPSPEISPEVESFIAKAESHADQLPAEISIAGDQITLTPTNLPKKPVVVLPITPEIEQAGSKKNAQWSVRWLVEWSRKLMKIFSGEIIYRQS